MCRTIERSTVALCNFIDTRRGRLFVRLVGMSKVNPGDTLTVLTGPSRRNLVSTVTGSGINCLAGFPKVNGGATNRVILSLRSGVSRLHTGRPLSFGIPTDSVRVAARLESTLTTLATLNCPRQSIGGMRGTLDGRPTVSASSCLQRKLHLLDWREEGLFKQQSTLSINAN